MIGGAAAARALSLARVQNRARAQNNLMRGLFARNCALRDGVRGSDIVSLEEIREISVSSLEPVAGQDFRRLESRPLQRHESCSWDRAAPWRMILSNCYVSRYPPHADAAGVPHISFWMSADTGNDFAGAQDEWAAF